jgi:signal transduction histidine kinase
MAFPLLFVRYAWEGSNLENAPELLSAVLTPGEFEWLSRLGEQTQLAQGEALIAEGDLSDHFYILLQGELEATPRNSSSCTFSRLAGDPPLLIGAVFMRCLEAATNCRLIRVGADAYLQQVASQTAASSVIIQGLIWRFRTTEAILHQSEKLASLGKLAAGLAHELNNPAAAGRRAASQLREQLQQLYGIAARLAEQQLGPAQLDRLFRASLPGNVASDPTWVDAVARADAEETVGAWLTQRGVKNSWNLAPLLVDAGMTPVELTTFTDGLTEASISDALSWISGLLSVESLLRTIDVCTEHISHLVDAVKAYAYMDRAPSQEIDIADGIESTLIILRHRLKRIELHREYQAGLPRIWAHGSELTQVWTNLLANAADALDGEGNIWIRTGIEDESLTVEIADDGPGIPAEVQSHIFEPFFSTKDTDHATGLGLDIVYSIVVRRHSGRIQVNSKPGDTRFKISLPLGAPAVDADALRPINVEKGIA